MKQFAGADAETLDKIKYLYIRAGAEHRFVPVWVVVVDGRVLVRPWNDKPAGWYRAFRSNPRGAIRVDDRRGEVNVRATPVRSAKLNDAVDVAYGDKYTTKANQKYVKGFATAKRKAKTLELLPS